MRSLRVAGRALGILALTVVLSLAAVGQAAGVFGVRFDAPWGFGLHAGLSDLLGPGTDLRLTAHVAWTHGWPINADLDAIWTVYRNGLLSGYLGAGVAWGWFPSADWAIGPNAVAGLEYQVGAVEGTRFTVFGEGKLRALFTVPSFDLEPRPTLTLGLNVRFR